MPRRIKEGNRKICKECKEGKEIKEFGFNAYMRKDGTKGRRSRCKLCDIESLRNFGDKNPGKKKESQRRWYRSNIKKVATKNLHWTKKNRFKRALISSKHDSIKHGYFPCDATTEELKAAFNGKCHNCNLSEEDNGRRLCVDHNHSVIANNFRGWLCRKCNLRIGLSDDSPELLRKTACYLERNEITT